MGFNARFFGRVFSFRLGKFVRFMSKKILIFSVLAVGIFGLVGFAKADIVGIGVPAGTLEPPYTTLYNQDSFLTSWTGIEVASGFCNTEDCVYMMPELAGVGGDLCTTPVLIDSELSQQWTEVGGFASYTATGVNAFIMLSDTNAVNGSGCFCFREYRSFGGK